jgi:hypothetical protein
VPNPYTSSVLYHLVGRRAPNDNTQNLATLRAILSSMEIRTNSVGNKSGGITLMIDPDRGCIDGEPIAQTVTCFCDIPFESLPLHTSKYGQFGVGVDRRLVAEWGGRPVLYIPTVRQNVTAANNHFCAEAMNIWKGLRAFFPNQPEESMRVTGTPPATAMEAADLAESFISEVLAFVKTFDVGLLDDHPENFYMEREWRKFANLSLHLSLVEIVAPVEFHARLREEFPQLTRLPFRAVRNT